MANHQTLIKELVTAIENQGIDGFINMATQLYTYQVRPRLNYKNFYQRTQRATQPLISFDEAIYYSSTFTQEHVDRFRHVLNNLGTMVMFAQKLTVIDYGCGQGLATLTFLHYLQQNNCIANKVIDIHLIEPSSITLALARQFILAMAKHTQIQVNITVHHQTLAEYMTNPVTVPANMTTLHFFSNVLDIEGIQYYLIQLSKYINNQQGEHFICAVSSYNSGFDNFRQGLSRFHVIDERFSINSYRFNSNRCVWTRKAANGQSLYAQNIA